jgi:hypothetical protein
MAGSMTGGAVIPVPAAVPRSHYAVERRQLIMQAVRGQGRVDAAAMAGQLQAIRALSEIRVDVAFLGTNSISSERGLSTPDESEALNLSDIDVLITGGELPERDAHRLESAGLKQVIRA